MSKGKDTKPMVCSYCGEEMFYREDMDFYICPFCFSEFWPGEMKQQREKYDDERHLQLYSLAAQTTALNSKPVLPPGDPMFKGGGKSGRKRKKKPKRNIQDMVTWGK